MNVAFPAVLLFLLVTPGFIFRQFSQRREVLTFDSTPFGAVAMRAVLMAAVFDLVVAFASHGIGYDVQIGDAVLLLVGGSVAASDAQTHLVWLNAHPLAPVSYFVATNGLALLLALAMRFAVDYYGLDRYDRRTARFVRGTAPWYYLFAGLDHPVAVDGAIVSAVVEFKEGSYLYSGILQDYECDDSGKLDRLMLVQAQRRRLEADRHFNPDVGLFEDAVPRFYPIAGDVFVLRYSEIKTLNVSYLTLPAEGEDEIQLQ
jgi:hypothetical protein